MMVTVWNQNLDALKCCVNIQKLRVTGHTTNNQTKNSTACNTSVLCPCQTSLWFCHGTLSQPQLLFWMADQRLKEQEKKKRMRWGQTSLLSMCFTETLGRQMQLAWQPLPACGHRQSQPSGVLEGLARVVAFSFPQVIPRLRERCLCLVTLLNTPFQRVCDL